MWTRAAVLGSLVGAVWGCGGLVEPCTDMDHKLNEDEALQKTVTCNTYGLWPQVFSANVTTTSADVNVTVWSVGVDKTGAPRITTLVKPTQVSDSAPYSFTPQGDSTCLPHFWDCYLNKHSKDTQVIVNIECKTKGGCDVDVSLSSGCGDREAPVNCVFTEWGDTCIGHHPPCYQHRFTSPNYNGGSECHGTTVKECECGKPVPPPGAETPAPTKSPGHGDKTDAPTPSPTLSPTLSPTRPGDTSAPKPSVATLAPSGSSGSSSKLPIILGAAGGGVVVLIIVGVVAWFKCRKGKGGDEQGLLNPDSSPKA